MDSFGPQAPLHGRHRDDDDRRETPLGIAVDSRRRTALVEALAEDWRCEPWRAHGCDAARIYERVLFGEDWADATTSVLGDHASSTSDNAVRVAPIAVVEPDLMRLTGHAQAAGRVTHGDRPGLGWAVVHAAAVALALHAPLRAPLSVPSFLDGLGAFLEPGEFAEELEEVRKFAGWVTPHLAAGHLGTVRPDLSQVAMSLLAFLRHPNSFVDAVEFAVRMGGATNVVAAMTGAVAGARHGASRIPLGWLARLENGPRLHLLADQLVRVRSLHEPAVEPPPPGRLTTGWS
ncbi:ADP-ribosylglycohydrolase family protein [Pseudonocardia nigra]|uniref:ADP-ribosylglycohydrolase family protein n=1 Tax=Pseudonocardia nigra TaxID=1921578 RepID=UPI001C6041F7|nr:ADP-ribosylglycohydrolase family protein [Pseudonocardia nigra]